MRQVIEENAYTFKFLDESDSYPYAIGKKAHGIHAINNDSSNELLVILTYSTGGTITIPVPANTTYNNRFSSFTIVNTSGSTNYNIGIEE